MNLSHFIDRTKPYNHSVDRVIAEDSAKAVHPFLVEIHNGDPGSARTFRCGDSAMTALVLADWARGNGRDARITRGGRLLWPKPTPTSTNRGM